MANLCGEGYAMRKDDSALNKRFAAIQPRVSEMSQEQLDRAWAIIRAAGLDPAAQVLTTAGAEAIMRETYEYLCASGEIRGSRRKLTNDEAVHLAAVAAEAAVVLGDAVAQSGGPLVIANEDDLEALVETLLPDPEQSVVAFSISRIPAGATGWGMMDKSGQTVSRHRIDPARGDLRLGISIIDHAGRYLGFAVVQTYSGVPAEQVAQSMRAGIDKMLEEATADFTQ